MTLQTSVLPAAALALLATAACQTAPAAHSGYLSSYEGVASPGKTVRASVRQRRDDAGSDAIARVYLQPAVLGAGVGRKLTEVERAMVLREVDKQICFEVSERFTIEPTPSAEVATIRTAIVRLTPTGRVGSAVSAAAGFFNPVPLMNVRAPMTTGGLAVESELVAPGGRQVAAFTWARDAQVVGADSPSLSRVGDALQLAEPMGDAVGDAFASKARAVRKIANPDPCAHFGPRRDIGHGVAGGVVGFATGLYSPEASGTGAQKAAAATPAPTVPN